MRPSTRSSRSPALLASIRPETPNTTTPCSRVSTISTLLPAERPSHGEHVVVSLPAVLEPVGHLAGEMYPEAAHVPLLERGGEVRRPHPDRIQRPPPVLDLGRHLAVLAAEPHDDLVVARVVVSISDHVRNHLVERQLDREEIPRADTVLLAELVDERGEPCELREPAPQDDRGARGHARHVRLYTPGTRDPSGGFARPGKGRLQRADRDVAHSHADGCPRAASRGRDRARRRRARARYVGGVHGAVEGARYRALSRGGGVLRRRERDGWHRRPPRRGSHL